VNPLIKLLVSTAGRVTRIVAGVALIAIGLLAMGGTGSIIVAVIGALPLVAGLFDFCVFAPLFGAQFSVPKARSVQ
jgi:Inner membrane protein YgaP-like, transmembrane domain